MNEHVFKKYEVGFCGNPKFGGVCIERGKKWIWYRADQVIHYSKDNYGLQGE